VVQCSPAPTSALSHSHRHFHSQDTHRKAPTHTTHIGPQKGRGADSEASSEVGTCHHREEIHRDHARLIDYDRDLRSFFHNADTHDTSSQAQSETAGDERECVRRVLLSQRVYYILLLSKQNTTASRSLTSTGYSSGTPSELNTLYYVHGLAHLSAEYCPDNTRGIQSHARVGGERWGLLNTHTHTTKTYGKDKADTIAMSNADTQVNGPVRAPHIYKNSPHFSAQLCETADAASIKSLHTIRSQNVVLIYDLPRRSSKGY
jgi:hypothetical protein